MNKKFFYLKKTNNVRLEPPSAPPAGTGRYSVGQSIYKNICIQTAVFMYVLCGMYRNELFVIFYLWLITVLIFVYRECDFIFVLLHYIKMFSDFCQLHRQFNSIRRATSRKREWQKKWELSDRFVIKKLTLAISPLLQ
jgi:hypothetical protein